MHSSHEFQNKSPQINCYFECLRPCWFPEASKAPSVFLKNKTSCRSNRLQRRDIRDSILYIWVCLNHEILHQQSILSWGTFSWHLSLIVPITRAAQSLPQTSDPQTLTVPLSRWHTQLSAWNRSPLVWPSDPIQRKPPSEPVLRKPATLTQKVCPQWAHWVSLLLLTSIWLYGIVLGV